jgi:vancomycin permeability regulator SanA
MEKRDLGLSQKEISNFQKLIDENHVNDVAIMLGVSKRTVYNYMKDLGITASSSGYKSGKLKRALLSLDK